MKEERSFFMDYHNVGCDSSLGRELRKFTGIDLKESNSAELPALEILLGHIATTISRNKYKQEVAKYTVLMDDKNNVVTMTIKGKGKNDKDADFAKFEGDHLVEIVVPHKGAHLAARCRDAFQSFFTTKDCEYLRKASFPGYVVFGDDILQYAFDLKTLDIPNLECAGDNFLKFSQIESLNAPKLKSVGDCFLYHNEELLDLNAPKLEMVGKSGLHTNDRIKKLDLPSLHTVGDNFLYANSRLSDKLTHLPKLKRAGRYSQPLINELAIYNKMKRR